MRIITCVKIKPGVNIQIIFDSGANHHVFNNIQLFRNLRNNDKVEITTADGTVSTSTKIGDVYWLKDVHYAPELQSNVISITQLDRLGFYFVIKNQKLKLFIKENNLILTSHMKHELYTITNIELAAISNKNFSQTAQTNLEIAVPLA